MITQCKPSKQHRVKQSVVKLSFSSSVVARIARIKFPNDRPRLVAAAKLKHPVRTLQTLKAVRRPFCIAKALWAKSSAAKIDASCDIHYQTSGRDSLKCEGGSNQISLRNTTQKAGSRKRKQPGTVKVCDWIHRKADECSCSRTQQGWSFVPTKGYNRPYYPLWKCIITLS